MITGMNLSASLFSSTFQLIVALVSLGCLVTALRFAPWRALKQKSERQHAFFAAWVSLILMMHLQIHWVEGISLHFLVMTSVVVIFGWALSLILGAGAHLLLMIWHGEYSLVIGVNYFLSVVIPASVAYWVFRQIVAMKSKNLFWFLLGGGFFGAILTLLISLGMLLLMMVINLQWETLSALMDRALIVVLLSYAEGFLNGMIVTAVTVFFPQIVKTFDEKKYLDS